jgi:gamma-glutamyl-gamma-aminobutyrate hydrolase PuuD
MTSARRPVIGLISDMRDLHGMPYQLIGDKYVQAVSEFADALPLGILAETAQTSIPELIASFDGFLFTGSPSNIRPWRYGQEGEGAGPFDDARDALALPLIQAALAAGAPCLCICRGLQELNVAQGGTLHVELPLGEVIHHAAEEAPYDTRYAPLHEVHLTAGSPLAGVFGAERFAVNSLHYQALERIGQRLTVHGRAPDGIPEVVAVDDHPFAIGVQWHPEYKPALHPQNRALFHSFGQAARARQAIRA